MSDQKRDYINRSGEMAHIQPYICRDTLMYGFFFRGDKDTIQRRLIDPLLNVPANGTVRYEVIMSSRIMATFAIFNEGRCTLPPDDQIGSTVERSWTLWIPLLAKRYGEFLPYPVFFPAYISVDNSWSVAVGREVYGYPKNYGSVTVPPRDAERLDMSTAVLAMPKYDYNDQVGMHPLMTVTQNGARHPLESSWTAVGDAVSEIAVGLVAEGEGANPFAELISGVIDSINTAAVPGVYLKQFRDAADGTKACYQAIIEAPSKVVKLHGGGLLSGDFTGWIANYDSHTIAADLGLEQGPVELLNPYWVHYDFLVDNGEEVWRAN